MGAWRRAPLGDGQRLVFVGGPPRSGTTLVQNVLDSHPEILGTPELLHLPGLLRLRSDFLNSIDRGFLEYFCGPAEVDRATYEFMERMLGPILDSATARYVSEKTPSNALVFSELHDLFPSARFVFVIRDPRAIVSSMQRVGTRARAKGRTLQRYTTNVPAAVREVKDHLAAGLAFASRRPDRCFTVCYEELTTRPREVTERLCEFLELEWSESLLYPERLPHAGEHTMTREEIWYVPDEFKRALTPQRNGAWKSELDSGDQILVTRAFRNHTGLAESGYRFDLDHIEGIGGLM
ncbi:MAG: sulfotransferase, partial [Gemmatimonadales bacterium]